MFQSQTLTELGYCRNCINEVFGIHMKRKDVLVMQYPYACSRCGKTKKIVCGARFPYPLIIHMKQR